MTSPRVLFCDFGGVLTPPMTEGIAAVLRAVAVPAPALTAAINQVAHQCGGTRSMQPLERGLLTQQEWGHRVTAALRPHYVPAAPLTRFGDYLYTGRVLNHALLTALGELRDRGMQIGLLTNSVREWEPHRAALMPDTELFTVQVKSHELGLCKPDPAIYRFAEQAVGTAPDDCLLIDDDPVNCAAARARGWTAIRHETTPATLHRLHILYPQRTTALDDV